MTHINAVELLTVPVSPKTQWLFVRLFDSDGRVGLGEATLQRREALVEHHLARMAQACLGASADPRTARPWAAHDGSMAGGAAASSLDHALWDLHAQRAGAPLGRALGGTLAPVPLYANVNRGLSSRTPAAFAAAARDAVGAGFDAVKIAPFDEVDAHGRWGAPAPATPDAVEAGLARIAAVRTALGAGRTLMVDCHWRFDEPSARRLIDAVAPYALHWLECPVPEAPGWLACIGALRRQANATGMRLAGGEDGVGHSAFDPFLDADAYDVLMPDIKYVGGVAELCTVAERAAARGVAISPHNPSGPLAHAASAHTCGVLAGFERLELQVGESPLFEILLAPPLPAPRGGLQPLPELAGLGVMLDTTALAAAGATTRRWDQKTPG